MRLLVSGVQSKCQAFHAVDTERSNEGDRAILLFLRSSVSAMTLLASDLSAFFHPYLHNVLLALLQLVGTNEVALEADIDRCFHILATALPARLAVPALRTHISPLLSLGPTPTRRLMDFLSKIWHSLDRKVITAYQPELSSIVILTLDYRREHLREITSNISEDVEEVETAIISCAVEFCIKLTEVELKSFLLKVGEWKNLGSGEGRASTFFQLMNALCLKLRNLFVPMLSYFWSDMITAIEKVSTFSFQSKSKKRKSIEDTAVTQVHDLSKEPLSCARWVLETLQSACGHDADGFIDEVISIYYF